MYNIISNSKAHHRNNSVKTKFIQPKLKIGQPGDKYEQEADLLANRVMSSSQNDSLSMQTQTIGEDEENIQMQPIEEEEELQMKCDNCTTDNNIQMQPVEEEEEELIQPKSIKASESAVAPSNIFGEINKSKGSGATMDEKTRSFMNKRFGANFNHVNIHTNESAVRLNKQLNAKAFTVGNDIFFNRGKYNPTSQEGKRLLAHELTHTIQQGATIQPMIQKEGEEGESEGSSSSSNPLADLVSGLVRDQLSNSGMRGHLSSLGTALQGLATESTSTGGDQPRSAGERLASLGVSRAFETTSAAILRDPTFAALRQRIIEIVGSSDEVALVTALAAGFAAVLADISVSHTYSRDIGAGFSAGGSFDFGSIQSLQFNNLQLYAQYANDHFRTRLSGSVSRDAETGEFSGSGTGEVRIGNDIGHLLGRVMINSAGEVVLVGRYSGGHRFGGSDQLVFTTDLTHSFATGETIIQPGVSGRFSLGSEQSIRLGSSLSISTDSGLTGVTGFIEYNAQHLQLRIEGSMTGIAEERGMVPGGDMRVQGLLTIPFF
jgi:hypothetical protein